MYITVWPTRKSKSQSTQVCGEHVHATAAVSIRAEGDSLLNSAPSVPAFAWLCTALASVTWRSFALSENRIKGITPSILNANTMYNEVECVKLKLWYSVFLSGASAFGGFSVVSFDPHYLTATRICMHVHIWSVGYDTHPLYWIVPNRASGLFTCISVFILLFWQF